MTCTTMQSTVFTTRTVQPTLVRRQTRTAVVAVKAQKYDSVSRRVQSLAVALPAVAAAMLMMTAPVEAKMHAGKSGNSSEASQSGYDMTGPKHRGIKPGQRKELLANARNTAQETIEKAKQAVK